MMKYLVRFYLQLEELLKNPVAWFSRQPWIIRLLTISLMVPLITLSSIGWYSGRDESLQQQAELLQQIHIDLLSFKEDSKKNDQQQLDDISFLKKEVTDLKKSMIIQQLDEEPSDEALGGQVVSSLEDTPDLPIVQILGNGTTPIAVYEKASSSSPIISSVEGNSLYFYLTKKDGWYELDLHRGKRGWVQADSILELLQ